MKRFVSLRKKVFDERTKRSREVYRIVVPEVCELAHILLVPTHDGKAFLLQETQDTFAYPQVRCVVLDFGKEAHGIQADVTLITAHPLSIRRHYYLLRGIILLKAFRKMHLRCP